jgi:hypothetical protein
MELGLTPASTAVPEQAQQGIQAVHGKGWDNTRDDRKV